MPLRSWLPAYLLALVLPPALSAQAPPTRAWARAQIVASKSLPHSQSVQFEIFAHRNMYGCGELPMSDYVPTYAPDMQLKMLSVLNEMDMLSQHDTSSGYPENVKRCFRYFNAKVDSLPVMTPPPYPPGKCGMMKTLEKDGSLRGVTFCTSTNSIGDVTGLLKVSPTQYIATFAWTTKRSPWADILKLKPWEKEQEGYAEISLWDSGWKLGRVRYTKLRM